MAPNAAQRCSLAPQRLHEVKPEIGTDPQRWVLALGPCGSAEKRLTSGSAVAAIAV